MRVDMTDLHRKKFDSYLESSRPRFSEDTYLEYVDLLVDSKLPQGSNLRTMQNRKRDIERNYTWEGGCLIFRRRRKVVRRCEFYDIIKEAFDRSGGLKETLFARHIRDNYKNITKKDVYKWLDLLPGRGASQSNPEDITEEPAQEPYGTGEESGTPSGEWSIQKLIDDFENYRWTKSLQSSRYYELIFWLHAILKKSKPADSSHLRCLTMDQATIELGEPRGSNKPILIRGDISATGLLKDIEGCLKDLEYTNKVDVQDLARRKDVTSAVSWPAHKVISRFKAAADRPPSQAPINILDLDCMDDDAVPRCFRSPKLKLLSRLKCHAGRLTQNSAKPWVKTEKWRLLGEGGSGTMAHWDHCGFFTWIRVEEGRKLWLICVLNDEDLEGFIRDGMYFTGGEWYYILLNPGDTLIMPPGWVHAVYTPVRTLCTGGNAWSQKCMGDSMRYIAHETEHIKVTNDDPIPDMPAMLERVSKWMKNAQPIDCGGEEQIQAFQEHYEVCSFFRIGRIIFLRVTRLLMVLNRNI
ncbi:hypothetical protein GP486_000399 [Trichoglossum hirsutum]|uniref:JmjC domain-containing protein n=1 Tax=Trichoglossum hirsutum TaxID=265104 RepID=A0A9P8LIU7_9PEZI|nr:hypothetical protein GP486_000399 [Trichoglossum hirsutum]